jgi:hypothetical protein
VIVKKKKHSWCAKVSDGSIALISIKGWDEQPKLPD